MVDQPGPPGRIDRPRYATALGASSPTSITLLGQDLAADVMGTVGFGELAFWLAAQRRPTPGQTRVFEAVLAALADHGFTPTAIVTRLTYLSAPESVQGAVVDRVQAHRTVGENLARDLVGPDVAVGVDDHRRCPLINCLDNASSRTSVAPS